MARIIGIDFGKKRCGLAWTDPMQIIASGIGYVSAKELLPKLSEMCAGEKVESFVLGFPTQLDGSDTDTTQDVRDLKIRLEKHFPGKPVIFIDEQFTSRMAMDSMLTAGVPKKKRRNKGLIDQVSATLILQDYLQSKS